MKKIEVYMIKQKNFIAFIVSLFMVTAGSVWLIKINNDHKECDTLITYSTGKNGEKITTEKHICKEKYNF